MNHTTHGAAPVPRETRVERRCGREGCGNLCRTGQRYCLGCHAEAMRRYRVEARRRGEEAVVGRLGRFGRGESGRAGGSGPESGPKVGLGRG